jgi:predicted nucleotidyltransferase
VNILRTINQIKAEIALLTLVLEENYHVKSLEIFGSFARGEQSPKSDLDLLVTFSGSYSLWDLLDVKEFLSKKLRLKIDLVPKDSIKPMLKEQITQEAIPI